MNDQADEDLNRVGAALETLGEFFDTVQIFATRHQEDGTVNVAKGTGNWFARYGQVRAWVDQEDEGCRERIRREEE